MGERLDCVESRVSVVEKHSVVVDTQRQLVSWGLVTVGGAIAASLLWLAAQQTEMAKTLVRLEERIMSVAEHQGPRSDVAPVAAPQVSVAAHQP